LPGRLTAGRQTLDIFLPKSPETQHLPLLALILPTDGSKLDTF